MPDTTLTTGDLKVIASTTLEIVITRSFAAPKAMVYAAHTQPELLKKWYGADGWSLPVCEIDLRIGGKWRFVSERPDGSLMGMGGEYTDILPDEHFAHSKCFDDFPGETHITHVLTEQNGRTTLILTTRFTSTAIRDGVLASGMEGFFIAAFARLDHLLHKEIMS